MGGVDVNEELKFGKIKKKKNFFLGGEGGGDRWGVGLLGGGGSGWM